MTIPVGIYTDIILDTNFVCCAMSMNIGQGQGYESYFGPASELVDIAQFISSVAEFNQESNSGNSSSGSSAAEKIQAEWSALSSELRSEVEAECRYALGCSTLHE